MPGAGIQDRYVLDAFFVNEPSQFRVDLSRGEVLGVELRLVPVDLGDVRDRLVEFDEAARVEEDLALGRRAAVRYLVHTITAPS